MTPSYAYNCTVVRWLDGDTALLSVDLGFYTTMRLHVRIYGINAPELHSADPLVRQKAQEALAYAQTLAPLGSALTVHTAKDKDIYEKYGRWLATLTLPDTRDFAIAMIAAGHAIPYFGAQP